MRRSILGIRGGLTLSIGLAVAIAWLAFRGNDEVADAVVWINHTHSVIEALNTVQSHAIDVEFIAGGRETDAHDRAVAEAVKLRRDLEALRVLVADNPDQTKRVEALAATVEKRLSRIDNAALMPAPGTPERRAVIGDGRASTAAIAEEIHASETSFLQQREAEALSARRKSQGFVVTGAFTSVVLLVFAFSRTQRESEARARANKEVRRLLDDEVKAAAVVRQARDDAQALTRELESFSYSVAHDLRAPLRSIAGFTQALTEDHGQNLDENGRDYLDRVNRAARRMGDLIDDLLALSRVSRGDIARERVDVTKIAKEISARLAIANDGRKVHAKIAEGIVLDADPRLVAVVLENLLSNAWKFTSKKSEAHVEVGFDRDVTREVFVRDDGAGFEMQHAARLFGAFQRLHRSNEFEGNGIGLATVQRVVNRHGGKIRAEAEVGKGATFYFTLEGARS